MFDNSPWLALLTSFKSSLSSHLGLFLTSWIVFKEVRLLGSHSTVSRWSFNVMMPPDINSLSVELLAALVIRLYPREPIVGIFAVSADFHAG